MSNKGEIPNNKQNKHLFQVIVLRILMCILPKVLCFNVKDRDKIEIQECDEDLSPILENEVKLLG